jgi:hypothetical protein
VSASSHTEQVRWWFDRYATRQERNISSDEDWLTPALLVSSPHELQRVGLAVSGADAELIAYALP